MTKDGLQPVSSIDQLRNLLEPDMFRSQAQKMRQGYLESAAAVLIERDLIELSPELDSDQKTTQMQDRDKALRELQWRISQIDSTLANFEETRKNLLRIGKPPADGNR